MWLPTTEGCTCLLWIVAPTKTFVYWLWLLSWLAVCRHHLHFTSNGKTNCQEKKTHCRVHNYREAHACTLACKRTLHSHIQAPGSHYCASRRAVRGTQRAENSVFMCVCLSHRKQGQETHAVSPPVTTFSNSPTVFTLHSLSPVLHQALVLCPCPCLTPLHLLPASFYSCNPRPTWSAC